MSEGRSDPPDLPTITCPVCERTVPEGRFCGACGASLDSTRAASAVRHHAFTAEPSESLLSLNVISTLFPHLPHRRTAPFRIALLVSGLLLLTFGAFHLTGPSIAVAAIAVPLLYLLYLYEVEVYEDEPILVIGCTFVLGLVLGYLWSFFTGQYETETLLGNVMVGASPSPDFVAGVVFPLTEQALMLLGAGVVYIIARHYDEALDGFTFGAMAALGFTLTAVIVNLAPTLQLGLVSSDPVPQDTLAAIEHGLFVPFLNASLTGLIAGAWWLRRGRVRALPAHGWTTSLPAAVALAIVVRVGLGLLNILVISTIVVASIYFVVTLAILLAVRVAIHHMLLAEAVEVSIGPMVPCVHCHYSVPRMAFCPHCGIATRATPKAGVGRLHRAVR